MRLLGSCLGSRLTVIAGIVTGTRRSPLSVRLILVLLLSEALKVIQGQLMNVVQVMRAMNIMHIMNFTVMISKDGVVGWNDVSTIKIHGVLHALPKACLIDVRVVVNRDNMERLHVLANIRGELRAAQVESEVIRLGLRLESIFGDEGVRVEQIRLALSFDSGKSEGQQRHE